MSELDGEVRDLTSSALRRVSRILVQRIHIELILPGTGTGPPTIEVSDEVLDAVTLAYVHMAGVFDALAIVNGLLAGMSNYREMGWQKSPYRRKLRPYAPDAVELMEPEVAGGKLLRAVLSLRNTIHKRMPDPATTGRAGGDPQLREMSLHLERRSHSEILDAFRDVGWTKSVGVKLVGDHLFLRPESALGLMLADGVPVLNQLLHATPVEALATSPLVLDPDRSLYPSQLRAYAIEYLGLRHLVAHS
ncbi:hypothetical protein [Georgenia wangjunii]|uniref:hypothetical protein n=1 Tax=Georgenia wangjunii TaxID=3117730 RepID=UPI002F26C991